MNRNFKLILAVVIATVLVGCGSDISSKPDPQRIANRDVSYDQYFTEIKADAAPVKPDEKGFVRRWTILEPINKPNGSNTVFTDSYIQAELTKEYFNNQFTSNINALPKTGESVIIESEAPRPSGRRLFGSAQAGQGAPQGAPAAGQARPQGAPQAGAMPPMGMGAPATDEPTMIKDTLTWHSVDSKLFNIKLIRFATGLSDGNKRYGLIFNAFTVINCEEDIPNVRLAGGSNAASIWWVNGEQVLTLQADRRMVADNGMSKRITLKKGKNLVRVAVINGPGMSDMCMRFYKEDGTTVLTNYTITNM